jgi:hypothetical protein
MYTATIASYESLGSIWLLHRELLAGYWLAVVLGTKAQVLQLVLINQGPNSPLKA